MNRLTSSGENSPKIPKWGVNSDARVQESNPPFRLTMDSEGPNKSPELKPFVWQSLKVLFPVLLRALLFGTALGFFYSTLLQGTDWLLAYFTKFVSRFVLWPPQGFVIVAVVCLALLLLSWNRLAFFLERFVASWRAGLTPGGFWIFLVLFFIASLCLQISIGAGVSIYVAIIMMAAVITFASARIHARQIYAAIESLTDPDLPIETSKSDILGRNATVSRVIEAVTVQKASVIAVVAPFGDGKTSLLNLVENALPSDILPIRFSSWIPGSEQALIGTLIGSITYKLKSRFLVSALSNSLFEYTRTLLGIMPNIMGMNRGVAESLKLLFKEKPQHDQINLLKHSVEELPIRLVVFVDDMDRMRKDELEIILKFLRGAAEFSNVSFVCAFDKNALAKTLGVEAQFLEKFFPVQIPLPQVEWQKLAEEFNRKFEKLCKQHHLLIEESEQKEFNDRFDPLWRGHIKQHLSNLRKLKLFFNKLTSTVSSIAEEINLLDFFLVELLRDNTPEIHQRIYQEGRFFYYTNWRIETWMEGDFFVDKPDELQQLTKYYNTLFEGLEVSKKALVLGILGELFPRVKQFSNGWRGTEPDSEQSFKQKRIYHPDFFPRYFIFSVPSSQFGEAEFRKFITTLSGKTASEIAAKFCDAFSKIESDSLKRLHFLRLLRTSVPAFPESVAEGLAAGVAKVTKELQGDSLVGEPAEALRIIFHTAKNQTDHNRRLRFLEEIITLAESDSFAAQLISLFLEDSDASKNLGFGKTDMATLKDSFANRMRDKYKANTASIFDEQNPVQTLFVWLNCGDKASKEEKEILAREFERNPQTLGKLISLVLWPGHPSYESQLEGLDKLVSLSELNNYLDRYGDKSFSMSSEKAVEEFQKRLRERTARNVSSAPDANVSSASIPGEFI